MPESRGEVLPSVQQKQKLVDPPKKWENPLAQDVSSLREKIQRNGNPGRAIFGDNFDVTYPERGAVTFHNEGLTVSMAYTPFTEEPRSLLERVTKRGFDEQFDSIWGKENKKVITQFSLTGEGVEETISLKEMLPKGWKIIYYPGAEEFDFGNIVQYKTIVVSGDLSKVGNIVSLLHECGHAKTVVKEGPLKYLQLGESQRKRRNQKPSTRNLSTILQAERNAWSFALRSLRPFIAARAHSALTVENVHAFVHDFALRTYNEDIAKYVLPPEELKKLEQEFVLKPDSGIPPSGHGEPPKPDSHF